MAFAPSKAVKDVKIDGVTAGINDIADSSRFNRGGKYGLSVTKGLSSKTDIVNLCSLNSSIKFDP